MAPLLDNSAGRKAGEGLKVLVIDDEPLHAETVAEGLERVGYECVLATSGLKGARLIEQDEFDVILTDLKMADLDGLAILRKAREELPEAEVIMITGHGDVKTAVEASSKGRPITSPSRSTWPSCAPSWTRRPSVCGWPNSTAS